MPNIKRLSYLFDLYIKNQLNEAEFIELFASLKQNPIEDELNPELFNLWNAVDTEKKISEPDWNKLYQNVTSNKTDTIPVVKIKRNPKVWYYAAAAVFIGIFSAFFSSVFHPVNPKVNYVTFTVPFGTTKSLVLADGSKVVLNAGSTIKYPQLFTGKTREVSLDGEAFFQVVHLEDKPFIVHSGKLQTQVLGTSFNVDNYANAPQKRVTVVSGKVAVKEVSTGKQLMLVANQEATLNETTKFLKKSIVVDAENAVAWQDGKLIFEDASLDEVATQLTLQYGIKTTLSNAKLKNCRITAVFQNKPLKEVLTVITKLTGSAYNLNSNEAVIYGKGCNNSLQ